MLTQEYLKSRLDYDPDTGILRWKAIPGNPAYNGRWPGQEAGTVNHHGYLALAIDGRKYEAHRLAWLWVHGYLPDYVDHINHNTLENWIANLRVATKSDNQCNTPRKSNNTSGYKGVDLHKKTGKWRARVVKGGKVKSLGYHSTREEAYAAYCKAAKELHGEFACLE